MLYDVKIQRWPTLLPPELFEFHNNGNTQLECNPFKFDICALALIILQLYDNRAFKDGFDTKSIILEIQEAMPQLFNVIVKMLDEDPNERPEP